MLITIGAKIAFLIWVLLEVALTKFAFKTMQLWAFGFAILHTTIVGYLMYMQNWTVFPYYVLIVSAIQGLMPSAKDRYRQELTIFNYALMLAVAYAVNFGAYGIIHLLNN